MDNAAGVNERKVHLLVLIHGMWGNPNHLGEAERIIKEVRGSKNLDAAQDENGVELVVLVAQSIRDESTYDGIDWGGEKIASEIDDRLVELEESGKTVVSFSVMGYSLGGLVARYLIGILHQRQFFKNVRAANFSTIATPNIGLLRYPSFFSTLTHRLGPTLLSRTGEQFYAVDKWSATGRPLLEVMADKNRIFYQALQKFENVTIYANAVNDITVPYVTAAIEPVDRFVDHEHSGVKIEFDPKYDPVIKSYSVPDIPPSPRHKPTFLSLAWFRSFRPSRFVPPPLQALSFPYNVLALFFLPVLLPALFTFALARLFLSSRSSRARIRLLESNKEKTEKSLLHIIAQVEREMEEAMLEISENAPPLDSGSSPSTSPSSPSSGMTTPYRDSDSQDGDIQGHLQAHHDMQQHKSKKAKGRKGTPLLTKRQLGMIASLNSLPQLKKVLAFIDPVRNSHATIVCRDIKRFVFHRKGEGLLRHWADHFVL